MRGVGRHVVAAVGGLLLAGCGGPHAAAPDPARPSELVGLWHTVGSGIPAGTYLKFEADGHLYLFEECGAPFGRWRATPGGAFAVVFVVAAPECPEIPGDDEWERNTPVWLRAVASFRDDGPRRVLLNGTGGTVATLTTSSHAPGDLMVGARDAPDPPSAEELAALDESVRPARSPADPATLPGTWLPEGSRAGVYVTFLPNGELKLRDGCNTGRGRWTALPGGGFAAALSLSYVVACDNAPIEAWLENTAWITKDDRGLVLVDAAGRDLGRLTAGS